MRGESGVGEMDKSIAANALVPEVVNSGLSAARSIQGGPVRIDCELFVASIEGVVLPLTRLEFDILHYLIGHRHRVVAQSEIVRVVVGGSLQPDSSLVRVHIAHLRPPRPHRNGQSTGIPLHRRRAGRALSELLTLR